MKRWRMLGMALALTAIAMMVGAAPRESNDAAPSLRLAGTYLQLNASHLEWQASDWEELFRHFEALGLSQLIVQWTVYEDRKLYAVPAGEPGRASPVETILQLADRAGMHVWVGLASEERYWKEIASKPDTLKTYLDDLRTRSAQIANELAPIVGRHVSFAGWYVPQEIDDLSWRDDEHRKLLHAYLSGLSGTLSELRPGSSVAVSGFANGSLDPLAFREFWESLLHEAPAVDTVLFQDGIGARKLDLYELPLYTAAIRKAADATGRSVIAIVELFDQIAGPPLDEQHFAAVPAPLSRIMRQLEHAHRYAPLVVAFSVPEYLSPKGGEAARTLYDEYLLTCVNRPCRMGDAQDPP